MTNNTRTTDDIERDIVDERVQMRETFNDLQEKFSANKIVNDIGDMVREHGGEFGRSVSHTVGRNPAAVVLVGVGLAWLFLGKDRTLNAKGTGLTNQRNGHSHKPAWMHENPDAGDDHAWYDDAEISPDRRFQDRSNGNDTSAGKMGRVHKGASGTGNAVSDTGDNWGQAASDLTERLSHGLEDLSEDAKSRVMSARRAALEASASSRAAMQKGGRAATDFFEKQPLVVGALAVAIGAAIGAALPHSKVEDDALGESSDRLVAEAQAVFREERNKAIAAAKKTATHVKDEIRDIGSEVGDNVEDALPEGKTVGAAVVAHATDAAGRIVDSTTDNAKQKRRDQSKT